MSFLEINYKQKHIPHPKGVRIISCQQVCGHHIPLDGLKDNFGNMFLKIHQIYPKKYLIFPEDTFKVIGPNSKDLTITANGKKLWYFVHAIKSERREINLLILGKILWGLEISSGMRLKKSSETHGSERIINYLRKQVESIILNPEDWELVECYYR